jgi:hypothetical protein
VGRGRPPALALERLGARGSRGGACSRDPGRCDLASSAVQRAGIRHQSARGVGNRACPWLRIPSEHTARQSGFLGDGSRVDRGRRHHYFMDRILGVAGPAAALCRRRERWPSRATPKDLIARLSTAAVESLNDQAAHQRFASIERTSGALRALPMAEIEKWCGSSMQESAGLVETP